MSSRFSTRQVTAMVVAVSAAIVLAPTTVWAAATASSVRITDGTGKVAQVDRSGHLIVGDGSGPLTVNGAVSATPTLPGTAFYFHGDLSASTGGEVVFSGGHGKSLYVTSFAAALTDANGSSDSTGVQLQVLLDPPSGSCDNPIGAQLGNTVTLEVSTDRSSQLTFPTAPLPFTSAKHQMCVLAQPEVNSNETFDVDVLGYTT